MFVEGIELPRRRHSASRSSGSLSTERASDSPAACRRRCRPAATRDANYSFVLRSAGRASTSFRANCLAKADTKASPESVQRRRTLSRFISAQRPLQSIAVVGARSSAEWLARDWPRPLGQRSACAPAAPGSETSRRLGLGRLGATRAGQRALSESLLASRLDINLGIQRWGERAPPKTGGRLAFIRPVKVARAALGDEHDQSRGRRRAEDGRESPLPLVGFKRRFKLRAPRSRKPSGRRDGRPIVAKRPANDIFKWNSFGQSVAARSPRLGSGRHSI